MILAANIIILPAIFNIKPIKKTKFAKNFIKMNIPEFIRKIEEEFEDLKPGVLKPDVSLREHFTWDSINALIFLAHVNVEYDVELTAQELIQAITVRDLYNMVESKANNK